MRCASECLGRRRVSRQLCFSGVSEGRFPRFRDWTLADQRFSLGFSLVYTLQRALTRRCGVVGEQSGTSRRERCVRRRRLRRAPPPPLPRRSSLAPPPAAAAITSTAHRWHHGTGNGPSRATRREAGLLWRGSDEWTRGGGGGGGGAGVKGVGPPSPSRGFAARAAATPSNFYDLLGVSPGVSKVGVEVFGHFFALFSNDVV